MKAPILIFVFCISAFSSGLYAEESKEAKELFAHLKPALLSLFPDTYLSCTHYSGNYSITDRTTYHGVKYVLKKVTAPVSEKELESYNDQLNEFFLWLKYWDALQGTGSNGSGRSFPFKKYAKGLDPERIPSLRYSIRNNDEIYVNLEIEFINRNENTLIIACRLLLTLPEIPVTDVVIENPNIRYQGIQNDRHIYQITFDLKNNSERTLNVATGAFTKSSSSEDGYSSVTLSLRTYKLGERIYPSKDELKIIQLEPGGVATVTEQDSNSEIIKALTLHYLPKDIFNGELDYWVGEVNTKLIQVEPVN